VSLTDEIKARIDIVDYVQRHVPALKKAGRNYKACCPFHSEKTPSFIVNPQLQSWRCFGACADGGDLFTFAQKLHGWDFRDALRELAREAGIELRSQTPAQQEREQLHDKLRGIVAQAMQIYQRELQRAPAALSYLRETRSLQGQTIADFQLGYAPDSWDFMLRALRAHGYRDEDIVAAGIAGQAESGRVYDRFRHRILFPIFDERGRARGFGARALSADEPAKYLNSPQSDIFDKSRLLYGLRRARKAIRDSATAVIVEGYMDVIQAHQSGYHNVVAQMGTALTDQQLQQLAPRLAQRVVIALDADEAGQNAARRSLEVARQALTQDYGGRLAIDIAILQIPSGKDPDDFLRETPKGWASLVEAAPDVADYVIEQETAKLAPDATLQQKLAATQSVLPLLQVTENALYRKSNIQKLARRLRIAERDMLAWLQEQPDPAGPPPAAPPDMPPEYWDNDYLPPDINHDPPDTRPVKAKRPAVERAVESHCLSILLQHPQLLAHANRKLRELAAGEDALLQDALDDLKPSDFSLSQYRALMERWLLANQQVEQEPLQFLREQLDDELQDVLRDLLQDEPTKLLQRLRGNFRVDLIDIVKKNQSSHKPGFSLQEELVSCVLQLRLARLEQERLGLQYLQEEANAAEGAAAPGLEAQIQLSTRAKRLINGTATAAQP